MGLFSPRKDTMAPERGADEASVAGRPRWFSGSRSSKVIDSDVDISSHGAGSSHSSHASPRLGNGSHESDHRGSTDRATVTLAQRLNELTASNADGLLGDEEYRLLRQNLFERFGAGSQIPTESPVVKLSPPDLSAGAGLRSASLSADPGVRSTRPASITSNSSRVSTITSAIRNALRRSSSRAENMYDPQEEALHADDVSMASGPSTRLPRRLKYQTSIGSLQSANSGRPANDTRSVSSYKTGLSSKTGRTSTSKGPPSSYHRPRRAPRQPLELDGEESSAEIRAEINAVEMEKLQLMENFQGLELSAVSRRSPSASRTRSASSNEERPSSVWTVTPDTHNLSSRAPSPPPVPKIPATIPKPVGPSIAERKRSLGMLSTASIKFSKSRDHIAPTSSTATSQPKSPPTPSPAKSTKTGFFRRRTTPSPSRATSDQPPPVPQRAASTSAVNGTARSLPNEGIDKRSSPSTPSDANTKALENIRKRKEETAARYDQRLDFLRARLKGAELRERLTR